MPKPNLQEIEKTIEAYLQFPAYDKDTERKFLRTPVEQLTGEKFPEPEKPIELMAGDVWAFSKGNGLRVVLIKNSDQLWEWGNNGTPSRWFYRYSDEAKSDADMIAFIKRNECIRIGHLEPKLIKD